MFKKTQKSVIGEALAYNLTIHSPNQTSLPLARGDLRG